MAKRRSKRVNGKVAHSTNSTPSYVPLSPKKEPTSPTPSSSPNSPVMNGNPRKSLRIMMMKKRNEDLLRRKKKITYIWPRTVEATKDPFEDDSGKNKWYFMLAIGVYPYSKILQPSDDESDDEGEDVEADERLRNRSFKSEVDPDWRKSDSEIETLDLTCKEVIGHSPVVRSLQRPRRGRRPYVRKSLYSKSADQNFSWRHNRRSQKRCYRPRAPGRNQIFDENVVMAVIDKVILEHAEKHGISVPNKSLMNGSVGSSESEGSDDDQEATEALQVRIVC